MCLSYISIRLVKSYLYFATRGHKKTKQAVRHSHIVMAVVLANSCLLCYTSSRHSELYFWSPNKKIQVQYLLSFQFCFSFHQFLRKKYQRIQLTFFTSQRQLIANFTQCFVLGMLNTVWFISCCCIFFNGCLLLLDTEFTETGETEPYSKFPNYTTKTVS